jgi:polypeptide N-acetylgalactosaminyltransferase
MLEQSDENDRDAGCFVMQTHLIQHGSSKKCLAISSNKQKLLMEECDISNQQQQWKFQNYDPSKL